MEVSIEQVILIGRRIDFVKSFAELSELLGRGEHGLGGDGPIARGDQLGVAILEELLERNLPFDLVAAQAGIAPEVEDPGGEPYRL